MSSEKETIAEKFYTVEVLQALMILDGIGVEDKSYFIRLAAEIAALGTNLDMLRVFIRVASSGVMTPMDWIDLRSLGLKEIQ